jgi:asparagine synthase (glutamine-hydrolysing)
VPGISLVCDLGGGLRRQARRIGHAVDAVLHDSRYRRDEWLDDDVRYLGYSAYPEYPIASLDLDAVAALVEGRFYGLDGAPVAAILGELADLVFDGDETAPRPLDGWLRRADGDFVVVLLHKRTHDLFVVNDLHGRLPLYYRRTTRRLVLSRELRFVTGVDDVRAFDRMAMAQHLLFGYPLGERTLLEHVHRLPAATSITVRALRGRIDVERHARFDCEIKSDARRPVGDTAAELADVFSRSCAARAAPDGRTVVSLSGGFDSRAIGAGLRRAGQVFRAATFLHPGGRGVRGAAIARRVADLFEVEWRLWELPPPPPADVLRLLRMKNGLNPLDLAFLVAFFDRIRDAWGPDVVLVSGEMGDRLLPDRRPAVRLAGMEDLIDHLIARDPKFALDEVSALTGLAPRAIRAELRDHLAAYPERDLVQKFVRFTAYERIFKWQTEGEDRNRGFFWTATPFAASGFFDRAVRCPDEQKSQYGLYREFLLRLSPEAAAIEHGGTGRAITSDGFATVRKVLTVLHGDTELRRRLQLRMGSSRAHDIDPLTVVCLRDQAAGCDAVREYLSGPALGRVTDRPTHYTKEALDLLFTLTATIEERLTGASVLERRARLGAPAELR